MSSLVESNFVNNYNRKAMTLEVHNVADLVG